jgi:photosystem II stability/assembly factor-like uncharacterized protein
MSPSAESPYGTVETRLNAEEIHRSKPGRGANTGFPDLRFHNDKSRKTGSRLIPVYPSPLSQERFRALVHTNVHLSTLLRTTQQVGSVNRCLRGLVGYYRFGHASATFRKVRQFGERRVRNVIKSSLALLTVVIAMMRAPDSLAQESVMSATQDLVIKKSLPGRSSIRANSREHLDIPNVDQHVKSGLSEAERAKMTSWQWLNPRPQGNDLWDVCVVDSNLIVAVGSKNAILRSSNGGRTWTVNKTVPDISFLESVAFGDARVGLAVGDAPYCLRTEDGGLTWDDIPNPANRQAWDVSFAGKDHAYIVGPGGLVLRSSDAGKTWIVQELGITAFLRSVSFSGEGVGMVAGNSGTILKTTDGGSSWRQLSLGPAGSGSPTLYQVQMLDSLTAFVSLGRRILATYDGGESWVAFDVGETIQDMHFLNKREGLAIGYYGDFRRTSDGGQTWTDVPGSSGSFGLYSMDFSKSGKGFAVGNFGAVFMSQDTGRSWALATTDPSNSASLSRLSFPTPAQGWASGGTRSYWPHGGIKEYQGLAMSTINGGVRWEQYWLHVSFSGELVTFYDSLRGAAIEMQHFPTFADNYIRRTTNGGASWFLLDRFAGVLRDFEFVSKDTAVAVGDFGIKRVTNWVTGEWQTIPESTAVSLRGVSFIDHEYGIAVGNAATGQPVVMKTTDGGSTWATKVFNSAFLFNDVFMISRSEAVMTATDTSNSVEAGAVLKSTDGGMRWSGWEWGGFGVSRVAFWSPLDGIAVGNNGEIVRSSDGGENWELEETITASHLNNIGIVRNGQGTVIYLCGVGGTIICSAVSPFSPKLWTWTGRVDSSWNTPGNWMPVGVPLPGDSVIIAQALQHPVIYQAQEQIVIASLNILPGGKLTITDSLKSLVVLSDVIISGTLEVVPGALTYISTGGNWLIRPGQLAAEAPSKVHVAEESDQGFLPGKSTVIFTGNGTVEGLFYSLVVDSSSVMKSTASIAFSGTLSNWREVVLQDSDTLFVMNADPHAILGRGRISGPGTIRRAIQPGAKDNYQFETRSTYVRFTGNEAPAYISMRTYPGANPDSLGTAWVEVPSRADPATHTVIADSVPGFSRWTIKIPRPRIGGGLSALRVYDIGAEGEEPYTAMLSLRYELSELPEGADEDSLRLFRMDNATGFPDGGAESVIPYRYELYQNYPNPFNPLTTIRYSLPHKSAVQITVFNTLGQRVAQLINGEMEAGYHEVLFDGKNLSSGVYFYRLQAGEYVRSRMFLLLR